MARQSITWIITDTHINHDAIINACDRPTNHVELTINNCKKFCAKQDLLIHLGDVIFYDHKCLLPLLSQIGCKKILVKGNHDSKSNNWYMNNGFDFACDGFIINDVILTHKPIQVFPSDVNYNIHGHWHNWLSLSNKPEWWSSSTHYCLSLEYSEYKPIKLVDIMNVRAKNGSIV